jgi:hypothetical protein
MDTAVLDASSDVSVLFYVQWLFLWGSMGLAWNSRRGAWKTSTFNSLEGFSLY